MINNQKPVIITLCGSTRFREEFLRWNKLFTLQGAIVLMPGVFAHSGDIITDEQKKRLDNLHKEKIAMSDRIFVIDKNKYIGSSTQGEIAFAKEHDLPIYYMSETAEKEEK